MLPDAHGKESRELLKRYTALRIEAAKVATDQEAITRFKTEIADIHNRLWAHAEAAANEKPSPVTVSYITSLNETIDLDTTRKAAMRNHVPGAVWLLLLSVAACGAWASGYGSGTGGLRSKFNQIVFPLLIAVVITLISDIDRPRRGLVGLDQQPLQELFDGM
jgi:hypothetical protein